MYTPRYLSQFNQAALVARLEALESEVAALNRAPREKRGPVSPAPAVIDALRKAERAEKRQTDIDRALKEAFEREAVRFAPGTPSETTMRLPVGARFGEVFVNGEAVRSPFLRNAAASGIFDQALRNRGMGAFLREATTAPAPDAFRERTGRMVLADIERAKETIRNQRHEDTLDCMGYLTKAMYQRLDPSATSQEIKRPVQVRKTLTGYQPKTVVMDDYDVSERLEKFAEPLQDDKPTPAELDAIRQSIMDSAKAQKERK